MPLSVFFLCDSIVSRRTPYPWDTLPGGGPAIHAFGFDIHALAIDDQVADPALAALHDSMPSVPIVLLTLLLLRRARCIPTGLSSVMRACSAVLWLAPFCDYDSWSICVGIAQGHAYSWGQATSLQLGYQTNTTEKV